VISKVAQNHKNKAFAYYTEEDIYQEIWIMALEKLYKFKPNRGKTKNIEKSLEHWLNAVISNQLKNLYRDKYIVPQRIHIGKNNRLLTPADVDSLSEYEEEIDLFSILENKELWHMIIDSLSDYDIEVLDSLLSGETVTSYYKNKVLKKIFKVIDIYESNSI